MKKHAYLILAHNNFYCLERLLKLLDDERNDIFLHVDKKVKNFDSDEIYKQTFISHFGENLSANDAHLILWGGSDRNHPHTFVEQDFDMLTQSERLFARKFDEQVDKCIIDKIYDYVS